MDFRKKKKKKRKIDKTIRASGLKSESILLITILHNQLDLWYGIIHILFKIIFLRLIFTHFYYIFDPHCPVQVNLEIFQVHNFAFLNSELKSTLNFSLENIIFYILANLFFHTKCLRNPGQILNPVISILPMWNLTLPLLKFTLQCQI